MSPTINRAEVERREARLCDRFGDPTVEEDVVEPPHDEFENLVAYAEDGYLGGAYVFVVRAPDQVPPLTESMPGETGADRDRVLLILGRGTDEWGVPGGGREAEEFFAETARREVREETGVECELADLFGVRRVAVPAPDDGDDRTVHLRYVFFEGRYVNGTIGVQAGECYGAAWFADLPEPRHPAVEPWADRWEE